MVVFWREVKDQLSGQKPKIKDQVSRRPSATGAASEAEPAPAARSLAGVLADGTEPVEDWLMISFR